MVRFSLSICFATAFWLGVILRPANAADPADITKLSAASTRKIDFSRDIQPLFARHCLQCHGEKKEQGGLRLDRKQNALTGGNTGSVIKPGKSADSLLVQLVAGLDPDYMMPPEGTRLSNAEIGLIRAWIDQGAVWPDNASTGGGTKGVDPLRDVQRSTHWSFQPVVRVRPPEVRHASKVHNEIDRFILARLERDKIEPSAEADRITLIRRLNFDLLGLPPTVAEVEAFVRDDRPDAYERLVDRLLGSPHYGERWGRHWLDAARYADSNGYNFDAARTIWKYRDWVIDAINRDVPFDQFVIEQLAGDLLPNSTVEQKIATGFHRNTLFNDEGGTDAEEFRVERVVDRVNTTGTVFLGLTVGCAECHSHKYDPISQREYYQLFAFFNNDEEPVLELPTPEEMAQRQTIRAAVAKIQEEMKSHDMVLVAKQPEWEQKMVRVSQWSVLDPQSYASAGGAAFSKSADQSLIVSGTFPPQDVYSVVVNTAQTDITGFRLEVLPDDSLPQKGPGRADNGNFLLTEFRVEAAPATSPLQATVVPLKNALADSASKNQGAALAIDNNSKTGWSLDLASSGGAGTACFETQANVGFSGGTVLTFRIEHAAQSRQTLGRFRLSLTTAPRPLQIVPRNVLEIIRLPVARRSPEQQKLLVNECQKQDPIRKQLLEKIAQLAKTEPKVLSTLVMQERRERRPSHIHIRGSFLRKGDEVAPNVPAVLPPLLPAAHADAPPVNANPTLATVSATTLSSSPPPAPPATPVSATKAVPTRLDLARWLVSPQNPLTARVTVNRVWQQFFGMGLVETENDFGFQGAPPTHPELLDWLASEFISRGWSMKTLHRTIVRSAAYRQASHARGDALSIDSRNRLLSHQNRIRLEGEIVRDATLAVSDLLCRRIGGPSVFPYQPDGVMDVRRARIPWAASKGENAYRRGMYTHIWRSSPHPFLIAFDGTKGETVCTRRTRSNTPLQALMLLNEPPSIDAARGLASRVLNQAFTRDADRLRFAFRESVSREPNAGELAVLTKLLLQQIEEFTNDSAAAAELAGARVPPATKTETLAAWMAVCRVIINLDEFITRE